MTEKYLDFSFEKTNSAYMLFYERRLPEHLQRRHSELLATPTPSPTNEDKPDTEESVKVEGVSNMTVDEINTVEEPEKNAMPLVSEEIEQKEKKQNEEEGIENEEESAQRLEKNEEQKTANCDNLKSNNNKKPQTSTSKAGIIADENGASKLQQIRPLLSKELEDWIWQDNRQFLQDRNIFEHTYFKWVEQATYNMSSK